MFGACVYTWLRGRENYSCQLQLPSIECEQPDDTQQQQQDKNKTKQKKKKNKTKKKKKQKRKKPIRPENTGEEEETNRHILYTIQYRGEGG